MKKIILPLLTLLMSTITIAQEGENIFGFQFKPIVSNKFIGEYERNFDSLPAFHSQSKQKLGYSFGMVMRHYFTDKIALETGINFTKRRFNLHYEANEGGIVETQDLSVGYINYQIPVSALFFIKLSDVLYMNASGGINFDFYPSAVSASGVIDIDNSFQFRGFRTEWIQFGANANFGFEYRTKHKGAFYLGATYNQPFTSTMQFTMAWERKGANTVIRDYINGSYLTLDFRYFLPVKKDKKG
jgi:hypothetical protein